MMPRMKRAKGQLPELPNGMVPLPHPTLRGFNDMPCLARVSDSGCSAGRAAVIFEAQVAQGL